MDLEYSQSQTVLLVRQRNMLAWGCFGLGISLAAALVAAMTKDREVILQPVASRTLTISSGALDKQYLELVTRDAAVLMLNRTPQSVEYWMEQVLKLAHPSAYGRLKGDLLKIVNDQRGSSVAQYFTIERMRVDPEGLTSEVSGVLHTMVGRQEVATVRRTYRFQWTYTGVELRLIGFGVVADPNGAAGPSGGATASAGAATP